MPDYPELRPISALKRVAPSELGAKYRHLMGTIGRIERVVFAGIGESSVGSDM